MTTGATPFYLMFGREMRSKLPDLRREAPITNVKMRKFVIVTEEGSRRKSMLMQRELLLQVKWRLEIKYF